MAVDMAQGAANQAFLSQGGPTFWMPPEVSEHARQVDWAFHYVYYISVFFFLLIVGLMTLFVIRYRRRRADQEARPSPSHNLPLEVVWTAVPIVLVGTMFFVGFHGYMNIFGVMPLNAYNINVTGQKWKWQFEYPTGYTDEDLHVPVGRQVQLTLTSSDVIHSLFVPALRLKRDVVPGRYTKVWFKADVPGEYPLLCAQYCGRGHSDMMARMVVHPRGEFEQWLEKASNFAATMPPVEAGRRLYQVKGCRQCHSLDGTAGVGPTFRNVFGHPVALTSGERVTADENYVRESILEPQARIVAGFQPAMPRVQLSDVEVNALIAFIRSQSDAGGEVTAASAPASRPAATRPAPVAP